jgi:hypothetical protein
MEAMEHAREHSLTLCKYHTPMGEHRMGLSVEEAQEIAREDPSLIYLDVELYPGEREISNMITKYHIERRGDALAIFPGRGKAFTEEEKKLFQRMKPEIMAELLRREKEAAEKKAAEEAARVEEARAIRAGEVMIVPTVEDYDGIPLYLVFGEAAKALKEIGAAKDVAYSTQVNWEIIKALGKEFTFPQAAELTRPAREAKEAEQRAREEERQAKFAEAKRTGEKVLLRSWMADCNDPREECSLDHVTEYAMPDGTTEIMRYHTW